MKIVCYAILEFKETTYRVRDNDVLIFHKEIEQGKRESIIEEWKHIRFFDWSGNNNSCDCNRALLIQRQVDPNFTTGNENSEEYEDGKSLAGSPPVDCGDLIKFIGLEYKEEE